MPNTQLRRSIDGIPGGLLKLETNPEISERLGRIKALRDQGALIGASGWRRRHGAV